MYHQPPPNVDSTTSLEGISGALPSKTPVSLLQELCMRRGISPKYDLLQIEGAVHEPTFVYRVTVGEFAANGSGQSKKKAKHAAAKAVLDIIIQGGAASAGGPTSGGPPGAPPELSTQIVSPYDDGIPGNPVGSLQELCMARRWPPPTYDLTSEEGFPHERTFSIACTIGTTKEVGTGKSKKLAKRQAAYKMTQRLKDQPVESPQVNMLGDDDDEVIDEVECMRVGLHDACGRFSVNRQVVYYTDDNSNELALLVKLQNDHLKNLFITSTDVTKEVVIAPEQYLFVNRRYFINNFDTPSESSYEDDSDWSFVEEDYIQAATEAFERLTLIDSDFEIDVPHACVSGEFKEGKTLCACANCILSSDISTFKSLDNLSNHNAYLEKGYLCQLGQNFVENMRVCVNPTEHSITNGKSERKATLIELPNDDANFVRENLEGIADTSRLQEIGSVYLDDEKFSLSETVDNGYANAGAEVEEGYCLNYNHSQNSDFDEGIEMLEYQDNATISTESIEMLSGREDVYTIDREEDLSINQCHQKWRSSLDNCELGSCVGETIIEEIEENVPAKYPHDYVDTLDVNSNFVNTSNFSNLDRIAKPTFARNTLGITLKQYLNREREERKVQLDGNHNVNMGTSNDCIENSVIVEDILIQER